MNPLARYLLLLLAAIFGLANGYTIVFVYSDGMSDTFVSGLPGHCTPLPQDKNTTSIYLNDPSIGVAVSCYDNPTCSGTFKQMYLEGYTSDIDQDEGFQSFNITTPCFSSVCTP